MKIHILPNNKVIEDVVFSKEQFANRVVTKIPSLNIEKERFTKIILDLDSNKSIIEQTKKFVEGNSIQETDIGSIKSIISQDLKDENLQKGELYQSLIEFFYQ